MSTLVLCSASGAPGVTMTALGLALTWPRDVLLVDADRTPSQAVLAGYLRGAAGAGQGLIGVLQAHRERRSLADAVVEQRLVLPDAPRRPGRVEAPEPIGRHFLPGFVHLGAIDLFSAVWAELGETLREAPHDTLVDAGRIGHRGLPDGLVAAADTVAVVCRTSLPALAALRLHLPGLVDAAGSQRVGLVLVGPGRPYAAGEIAARFEVDVLAEIAWDAATAGDLADGVPLAPRWAEQALARSYARAAAGFVGEAEAQRVLLGVPA